MSGVLKLSRGQINLKGAPNKTLMVFITGVPVAEYLPDHSKSSLSRLFTLQVCKVVEERLVLLPHEALSLHLFEDSVLVLFLEKGRQSVLQHDVGLVVCVV